MKNLYEIIEDKKIYIDIFNTLCVDMFVLKTTIFSFLDQNIISLKSILAIMYKENEYLDTDSIINNYYYLYHIGLIVPTPASLKDIDKIDINNMYHIEMRFSAKFFEIVAKENIDIYPIDEEITGYKDINEYYQDRFEMIKLLQQIKISKIEFDNKYILLPLLKMKYRYFEEIIPKRLAKTKITIPIERWFKKYKLSDIEQMIIWSLLKDEFFSDDLILRDLDTLLTLFSTTDRQRIKLKNSLFNGKTALTKKNIINLEYGLGVNLYELSTICYLSVKFLYKIDFYIKKKKKKKISLKKIIKNQDVFEFIHSKYTIDDVVLNPSTKETLNDLLAQVNIKVIKRLQKWDIKSSKRIDAKIIFHGVAGTGKTMTAIALANSLKRDIISLDCSKILSKWVGESEQNVRSLFDNFKKIRKKTKTDPILLLNEADQFLSTRTNSTSGSDKMHNQMQNIFLEQIERFDGILIATTNLLQNIDTAFSRRFNYKIKFTMPDEQSRAKIWQKLLPPNIPLEDGFDIQELAPFQLTGGQIELVIKNTAYKVATQKKPLFTIKQFKQQIEIEQNSMFDGTKSMGFLS